MRIYTRTNVENCCDQLQYTELRFQHLHHYTWSPVRVVEFIYSNNIYIYIYMGNYSILLYTNGLYSKCCINIYICGNVYNDYLCMYIYIYIWIHIYVVYIYICIIYIYIIYVVCIEYIYSIYDI